MKSKHFNLLRICFLSGLIISTLFVLDKAFAVEQKAKKEIVDLKEQETKTAEEIQIEKTEKKIVEEIKEETKETEQEKVQPAPTTQESNEIVFGQSLNLDGSFKLYGNIIKNGILACFNQINEDGGINGKVLKLVSMDDKGDPKTAESNIKEMFDQYDIDMFLGNMGTRSLLRVLPLIELGKIAMLFPWGGDEQLRAPGLSYIINGPSLIEPQIDALTEYIVKNLRLKKIALFHSDGGFSIANAQTAKKTLGKYNITPTIEISYNRFTMNIMNVDKFKDSPADAVFDADPKVVMCLATSMPSAKLIGRFFEYGFYGTLFFGIDSTLFVGDILKAKGAKFYYTSAVPDPKDPKLLIVKEYQEALKKFFPKETFNVLSLSYYISAKIIVQALKKISGKITKEKLLAEIEKMKNFDLEGFTVKFNPQNRHAFGEDISIIKG